MEARYTRFTLVDGQPTAMTKLTATAVTSWEFPQINERYATKEYTFVYSLISPYFDPSGIVKVVFS